MRFTFLLLILGLFASSSLANDDEFFRDMEQQEQTELLRDLKRDQDWEMMERPWREMRQQSERVTPYRVMSPINSQPPSSSGGSWLPAIIVGAIAGAIIYALLASKPKQPNHNI